MKMEKNEFGNKTDFIGPYNYNIFFVVIKIYQKWTIAFKMT